MKLIQKDGYLKAENYKTIEYTDDYYKHLIDKYEKAENTVMNKAINKLRTELVNEYCFMDNILDIGCGTGSFITYMHKYGNCFAYGYELIPKTVDWLKGKKIYINPFKDIHHIIKVVCMWDVLEHLNTEQQEQLFSNIHPGTYLFLYIVGPIVPDNDAVHSFFPVES